MSLSKAQQTIIEKARAVGGSQQGVVLTDSACAYLVATIAQDLDVMDSFPELPREVPPFFSNSLSRTLEIGNVDFMSLAERLFESVADADTYFASLAKLHKARLKYERVLETQPMPTVEQVGPRALLEYGKLSPKGLAGLLFWRKWFFDIDNRAAQETGYLFEPIIAGSIGGVPVSARRSPVRRHGNPNKGRQVDCIAGNRAYELKIRVTTAASGQGRWKEEITFPRDCRKSGYTPVLIVLDATPNPKLDELVVAFQQQGGDVYVGEDAWEHLDRAAGSTMSIFLERYVHGPIQTLLRDAPQPGEMPRLCLAATQAEITIQLDTERFVVNRKSLDDAGVDKDHLPYDIDEELPG